uniref:Translationally-controlled tumor protein homolog n=2 Tax=Salmoninae TaxID=504568 RepID=B5X8N4_SALSA|nr:Translationally-controlled tumor protein [Salmo salar]ADM15989.1 Translationally-controlled tumor protein [Salmo salar]
MIIYKDIITGDELFTEVYKITEVCDGMLYEVQGKLTSRSEDVDGALIGANASAEGGDEGSEASTVSGVDIVLNSKLQETSAYNKKAYQSYIKGYMKAVKAKLEEQGSKRVQAFMAGAPAAVKMILGNLDKYQFFTGESMNCDGAIGLLDYREDGVTPFFNQVLFFAQTFSFSSSPSRIWPPRETPRPVSKRLVVGQDRPPSPPWMDGLNCAGLAAVSVVTSVRRPATLSSHLALSHKCKGLIDTML